MFIGCGGHELPGGGGNNGAANDLGAARCCEGGSSLSGT